MRAAEPVRAVADAVADRIVERRAAAGTDVVRAPPRPAPPAPSTAVADALLRGDEAFASLALVEAERAIDDALSAADDEGVRARSELVAVLLLGSMIHGARGDEAGADEAARGALAVDPTLTVDLERYPPTLADRVERLRPAVARCPLALVVDPADATVAIDGVLGAAPTELPCGAHWITVERRGYTTETRRVALAPDGAAISIALALDPAAALAAAGPPGTAVDPLVERGAAALGRTLVVLDLRADETGAITASLDVRTVRATGGVTPDELADALLAPIDTGLDTGVVIGIGVGVGAAVAAAIAIGLAVALGPSAPPGWIGVGEVVPP